MSTRSKKRRNPDKEEDDEIEILNPAKKRKIDVNRHKNIKIKHKKRKPNKKQYKYHPGDLQVDWAAWPDHDERCHGRIDTNANRREYPENFTWDCCDKHGDESGCELRSRPATPIDDKYETSPEPSLDEDEYYHPGYLEVDWEAWPDHDEDCHGPIDTKTNRGEYPEGFMWSCCGKNGTYTQGCCRQDGDSDDDEDEDEDSDLDEY